MENEEFIDIRELTDEQIENHIEMLKTQQEINKLAINNLINNLKKPELV